MRKKLLSTLMLLAATTGVANAAGEFAFAVENDYTFYFRPISDTEVAIIHPSEYDPNLGPYVGSFAWDMPETVTYDGVTYTVTTVAEGAFRNATVCGSNQYTNMFWFPGSITTYEADAFDNWTCNIVGMYGTTIDSKAFRNNNINRFRCFVTGYSSSEDNDHGSYNGNDMGGDVYKTVDGRTILVGWGGDHRVNAWVKHITGAAANRNITTEWTFNYDEIGDYALYGNSNLTTVTIAGATRIGVEAMKNMTALTTLTLPATLTEIDTDAFAGATAISTITCNATTPPTGAVFDETVYERIRESGNITVPEEALAAYQADENWGQFWASAPAPTTYTVSVLATENGTVVADKAAAAIGETVTLTVTPAEGYELESLTVTAGYEVQGGSGGGRAPRYQGGIWYNQGNINLTQVDDNTYTFVLPDELPNVLTPNYTDNTEFRVSATFAALPPVESAVTFTAEQENGSMAVTVDGAPVASGATIAEGATVTVVLTPAEGYKVASFTVETIDEPAPGLRRASVPVTDEGENTYSFQMPGAPITMNAEFTENIITAITDLNAAAGQVTYVNVMGQTANRPFNGVNIVMQGGKAIGKLVK